jgi:hypothetical protein
MSATLDVRRGSGVRRGARKRRWRGAEPIEMRERRHGYFPKTFVWRGQRYDVCAVERCWTVSRRGGRVEQHRFQVRCSFGPPPNRREGTFEVYQDARHNTWHVAVSG